MKQFKVIQVSKTFFLLLPQGVSACEISSAAGLETPYAQLIYAKPIEPRKSKILCIFSFPQDTRGFFRLVNEVPKLCMLREAENLSSDSFWVSQNSGGLLCCWPSYTHN